jgi:hypothetical protein
MSVETIVRLPEDLMEQAQLKAIEEGRSLSALIEDGLPRILSEQVPTTSRTMPRVSTATGGTMPGVDLDRLDELQGLEDLEYVRRFGGWRDATGVSRRCLGHFQGNGARTGGVREPGVKSDEDMAAVGGARQMQRIGRRKF